MPLYDLPLSARVKGEVGVTVNADFVLAVDLMSDIAGFPVVVFYRVVGPLGQLYDGVHTITTNGLSAQQQTLFPLPAGIISGVSVGMPGGLGAVGEARCRIGFDSRGGDHVFAPVLIDGYVGGGHILQWPVPQPNQVASDRGKYMELQSAVPAAGAEAIITIAAGQIYEPVIVTGQFVASAVAGTRYPTFGTTLVMTGGTVPIGGTNYNVGAGMTRDFTAIRDSGIYSAANPVWPTQTMGSVIILAGYTLQTITNQILAGDQWGAITAIGYRRFEF